MATIQELETTIRTMRAAKQFTSEYYRLAHELAIARKAAGIVLVMPDASRFTGSFAAAVAHFGGPVRKIGGGLLAGGPSEYVRA
jgi:hypothetical protein